MPRTRRSKHKVGRSLHTSHLGPSGEPGDMSLEHGHSTGCSGPAIGHLPAASLCLLNVSIAAFPKGRRN